MLELIPEVAGCFVRMVLEWKGKDETSTENVALLLETVQLAGFAAQRVEWGKLLGSYRDQDGSATGETYPINGFCPYQVVSHNKPDYSATGWLDCALRRVVFGSSRQQETPETLVTVMTTEIERSRPLDPIRLTANGDQLLEYPPSPLFGSGLPYFVNHTRDTHQLSCCVGVHANCRGCMDIRRNVSDLDEILCRSCHLRVTFPKGIETYSDLRAALATA